MTASPSSIPLSSASLITFSALGGAVTGFVLQLLVAYFFGASNATDAYFMAQSTSEMVSKLLLGGSITAVFLPMFVERLTRGDTATAWHLALNIMHVTATAMIIVLGLLMLFAEPFIHFIAPGFDAATTTQTVNLLRILAPSFLLLFLVDLATAMLHSLKHFLAPALLRILAPLTSIIFLASLVHSLGIIALAIGAVIGSLLQLTLVLGALRRYGFRYRWVWAPHDPAFKQLVRLTYPFILSVLLTQAAGIVYRILVSNLAPGSLSALKYAEKITQLAAIMFLNAVTTVIYPLLSEYASQRNYLQLRSTLAEAIRLITLVTIPLVIGLVILREPLIALLFERGSFTHEDARLTSIALGFLALGLTINGISSILGHAVLALQQTRAAVAVTIASQAVAIFLFVLLVPSLGHAGLALGSSLVPLAIALLYFLYLTRTVPHLALIFKSTTFIKITVLAVLLFATLLITRNSLTSAATALPAPLPNLITLIIPGFIGILVFFGGAYLWHIPEMRQVTTLVQQKLLTRRRHDI